MDKFISRETRDLVASFCHSILDKYAKVLKEGAVLTEEELEECSTARRIIREVQ